MRQDFGDLLLIRQMRGTVSSSTRGLFMGGNLLQIQYDYVTIASTGMQKILVIAQWFMSKHRICSNSTRGFLPWRIKSINKCY